MERAATEVGSPTWRAPFAVRRGTRAACEEHTPRIHCPDRRPWPLRAVVGRWRLACCS
jgi:hypothetical protein